MFGHVGDVVDHQPVAQRNDRAHGGRPNPQRDHSGSFAFAVQPVEHGENDLARGRVEVARRFVGQISSGSLLSARAMARAVAGRPKVIGRVNPSLRPTRSSFLGAVAALCARPLIEQRHFEFSSRKQRNQVEVLEHEPRYSLRDLESSSSSSCDTRDRRGCSDRRWAVRHPSRFSSVLFARAAVAKIAT